MKTGKFKFPVFLFDLVGTMDPLFTMVPLETWTVFGMTVDNSNCLQKRIDGNRTTVLHAPLLQILGDCIG